MNSGALLFLGIFFTLASSFWGLVLLPQVQIGRQQPIVIESTGALYPTPRSGQARQGAEVYRSLGCVECHSQQVRQTGVQFDVWLTDAGTNKAELVAALVQLKIDGVTAGRSVEQVPVRLLIGLDVAEAQKIQRQLTNGGAKAQAVLATIGPDIQRGWGSRISVAQDYLYDDPVLLGSQRIGPDLANYGLRANRATNAVLLHLYKPQGVWPESVMPPFPFLFENREIKPGAEPPEGTIDVFKKSEFGRSQAVVPKPAAHALVAYLMSLQADAPLFEAPAPKPATAAASTNAPPASTNAVAPSNPPAPVK